MCAGAAGAGGGGGLVSRACHPGLDPDPCWFARAAGYACWPGLAPAGEALFFASPKKSTQKKGDPKAPVADATALCFSEQSARAELAIANNAIAQTCGALSPIAPAMLGGAYGGWVRFRFL